MDRNNTSFSIKLFEYLKNVKIDSKWNFLKYYINKKFSFVSMNASNMMKQMLNASEGTIGKEMDKILSRKMKDIVKLGTLDNKLLIIDEAHNLFRAVTNGSQNAKELYDMIINSKDLKLILLTGTPIANNPFELAICFNMLAGKPNKPLMPEDYIDFYNYFIDEENRTIKNKEKFQNRLFGLVSYISYDFVKSEEIELPKELNTIIRYLPMQPDQYMLYQLARDKELEEKQKFPSYPLKPVPSLQKPRNAHASSYRVRSRQASNFAISNINNINKIIDPLDLPFVASPQIVDEQITSNKLIDLYQNLSNS